MHHGKIQLALLAVLLAACVPSRPGVMPPDPSRTAPATGIIASPTAGIQVDSIELIDPRLSNPEFFDVTNPDSALSELAGVLRTQPSILVAGLKAETGQGIHGSFVIIRTSDGFPFLLAKKERDGAWAWEQAGLGNLYFEKTGKHLGLYMSGHEFNGEILKIHAAQYFAQGGIISTKDQIPEWADMMGALNQFEFANQNQMILMLYRVVGSGRFGDLDTSNVEAWLTGRVTHAVNFINRNGGQPTLLVFDKLLKSDSAVWNSSHNPLRDKWGDQWFAKYLVITLRVLLKNGFVPNRDFYLTINEADLYDNKPRLDYLIKVLSDSRSKALTELAGDPDAGPMLQRLGLTKPEQLVIVVGAQTHGYLDGTVEGAVGALPTADQVDRLAEEVKSIGPLLMTEVDPLRGTDQQKEQYLAGLAQDARSENLMGLVLWTAYFPPLESQETIGLFNQLGFPTETCLQLMKTIADLYP